MSRTSMELVENSESATSMYLTFVSVMLTAVTIVLASVAVGVGFFAIFTRREIKDAAQEMAENTVADILAIKLSDQAIKDRIDSVAFGIRATGDVSELEENFDPDDSGDR